MNTQSTAKEIAISLVEISASAIVMLYMFRFLDNIRLDIDDGSTASIVSNIAIPIGFFVSVYVVIVVSNFIVSIIDQWP